MKSLNILHNNIEETEVLISTSNLGSGLGCLVVVHVSSLDLDESLNLAKKLKALLPDSEIIGTTVSGVVYNGKIYPDGDLISIFKFENSRIFTRIFSTTDIEPSEISEIIAFDCQEHDPAIAFLYLEDTHYKSCRIIDRLNEKELNVPFIGGGSGTYGMDGSITSFVFNHEQSAESGILYALISSEFVLAYTNAVIGHDCVSDVHTITKVTDCLIEEINGTNALDWVSKQLALPELGEGRIYNGTHEAELLLYFPFVLEEENGASRFYHANPEDSTIKLYHSTVEVGQQFRLAYSNPLKSVDEWQKVCYDLQTISSEALFCYSCVFRRQYLQNLAKWEMIPFTESGICGAFMMGEFGTKNNKIHFFHGSCMFLSLAQQENYIDIDLTAFDSISGLHANKEFIDNFLQTQIDNSDITKDNFYKALLKSESRSKSRVMSSNISGAKTMTQFLQEQAKKQYKKICFVSVAPPVKDSDSITENRIAFRNETIRKTLSIIDSTFPSMDLSLYIYSDTSFFITSENPVRDAEFIEAIQTLYTECKQLEADEMKLNFAITISGVRVHELEEKVLHLDCKSEEGRFVICDISNDDNSLLQKEFELVAELNQIIKNDKVIPYFQGIYDNSENRFYCYESLMRLQNSKGKILFPGDFMDISKKYNLYEALSMCMVCRVLEIFAEREEIITMNVSIIDICSEKFNEEIFKRLSQAKNPERFIFELVETEKFSESAELRDFICKVRSYGSKIAIDDFGSGYSNFIEIGNLDIDFIKINGTLTERLDKDSSYNNILDSIFYLGNKLNVKLIAECVETAAMQKSIISAGIQYSQGYFFSKPMSLDELFIVSAENSPSNSSEKDNEEKSVSHLFNGKLSPKRQMQFFLLGGIIATLLAIISSFIYVSSTNRQVSEMSDLFLIELASGMAEKISIIISDAEFTLETGQVLMSDVASGRDETLEILEMMTKTSNFDNMYISFDDQTPIDYRQNMLGIENHELSSIENSQEVQILSPIYDTESGNDLILIKAPVFKYGMNYAEIYGSYNLDDFSSIFNLQSFGGDAFYHLCEVDGTPILLSGDSDNMFTGGDMYEFIGSLDIQNGHTKESIQEDMVNGETVLLKYNVNKEERTAVMLPIPNTPWCIVSIILDEVALNMASEINSDTLTFSMIVILSFSVYFTVILLISRRHQKELMKALKSSSELATSLQTSIETDPLTRTLSRATATEKITSTINKITDPPQTHALILLDVDNFKMINDVYGHNIGDIYLQEFSSAVKSRLRSGDILGRLGGDEFVILLSNTGEEKNVRIVVQRIIDSVNNIEIPDVSLDQVSVSAGIAMIPVDGTAFDDLSIKADKALYRAKHSGKNAFRFHSEL